MPQSAIGDGINPGRFPADRRNEQMQKISRNARRLRQGVGVNGAVNLNLQGRNDSLEQLAVRLGVIPILNLPTTTSLQAVVQAYAPRRPAAVETVNCTGGTAVTSFISTDAAKVVPFTAGGPAQVMTATDSVDSQAKGRALIDILP